MRSVRKHRFEQIIEKSVDARPLRVGIFACVEINADTNGPSARRNRVFARICMNHIVISHT